MGLRRTDTSEAGGKWLKEHLESDVKRCVELAIYQRNFMHGSKGAPLWFLWVHLFMNYLMIIPFGSVLEAKTGSKNTFFVFIAAMLLQS